MRGDESTADSGEHSRFKGYEGRCRVAFLSGATEVASESVVDWVR